MVSLALCHKFLVCVVFTTLCLEANSESEGDSETCAGVLFVYYRAAYLPQGEQIHFALSRDGRHFDALNGGAPVPGIHPPNLTYPHDPFVAKDQDGIYRMVATDGSAFGMVKHIIYWWSSDLVHWSQPQLLPVMGSLPADRTRAPEWFWDSKTQEYVLYWTVKWAAGEHRFDPHCNNTNLQRVSLCSTRLKDWEDMALAAPTPLWDAHCYSSAFSPFTNGSGVSDANSVIDPKGSRHFVFRDVRFSSLTPPPFPASDNTSGARFSTSIDELSHFTDPKPRLGLVGPWGVEGPELLKVNDTLMLYFDCVHMPTPPGYPKPPFGAATAPYPQGLYNQNIWKTLPGSCTGNQSHSQEVVFPIGASQGSFLCISEAEYQRLSGAWNNAH